MLEEEVRKVLEAKVWATTAKHREVTQAKSVLLARRRGALPTDLPAGGHARGPISPCGADGPSPRGWTACKTPPRTRGTWTYQAACPGPRMSACPARSAGGSSTTWTSSLTKVAGLLDCRDAQLLGPGAPCVRGVLEPAGQRRRLRGGRKDRHPGQSSASSRPALPPRAGHLAKNSSTAGTALPHGHLGGAHRGGDPHRHRGQSRQDGRG